MPELGRLCSRLGPFLPCRNKAGVSEATSQSPCYSTGETHTAALRVEQGVAVQVLTVA